jgi:hypothetical protein
MTMDAIFVFRAGKYWGMSENSWQAIVKALGLERANAFSQRTTMSEWRYLSNYQKRATFYAKNGEEVGDLTKQ